jgi:ribose transport system ATP-binding protein
MLKLINIRKSFGPTVALAGVNLTVQDGSVHALIGENGAGKSTLMNILGGSIAHDGGEMTIDGSPYVPVSTLAARKNRIAVIHQELSLAPHLTVAENILMGIESSRLGWLDRRDLSVRCQRVLNNFDRPDIRPEMQVRELSVASRQLVEICRAIAANAQIILMDEPTSSLQRNDVVHLFALIRKLKDRGISIVYISHFLEEIREVADHFTVLRDGKSVADGRIDEVDNEFLISQMVGRPIEHVFPRRRESRGPYTILEVNGLSSPPILRSASFKLRKGEILGIAGLVASGRSELLRAIFGLEKADSGEVSFDGTGISITDPVMRKISQGFGYLSEDRNAEGVALPLSIADNLTMTKFSSCSRLGWIDLSKQRLQSNRLIEAIGVKAHGASQPVSTLSGGNQQKIALGRLIYQGADILLLDEPTRGIDIGSKTQVYQLIADLADSGKAILFVSSYLPELFGMCDSLAVMSRGRLSETMRIGDWTPEKVMRTAIEGNNDQIE